MQMQTILTKVTDHALLFAFGIKLNPAPSVWLLTFLILCLNTDFRAQVSTGSGSAQAARWPFTIWIPALPLGFGNCSDNSDGTNLFENFFKLANVSAGTEEALS